MWCEQAIADCKWAQSLSETALKQHLDQWSSSIGIGDMDWNYHITILAIKNKLGSEECLLISK